VKTSFLAPPLAHGPPDGPKLTSTILPCFSASRNKVACNCDTSN
jgi:hypothetical protein